MRKNGNAKKRKYQDVKAGDIIPTLTVELLALKLNVGTRTIWRWDKDEKIPAPYQIGLKKRWELSDIELWLEWDCPKRKEFNQLKKERVGNGKNKSKGVQTE